MHYGIINGIGKGLLLRCGELKVTAYIDTAWYWGNRTVNLLLRDVLSVHPVSAMFFFG